MGGVLYESGTEEAECLKVGNRKKVASAIRSLVNGKGLQFECARVLHKTMFVLVLMYGNENDMEGERA